MMRVGLCRFAAKRFRCSTELKRGCNTLPPLGDEKFGSKMKPIGPDNKRKIYVLWRSDPETHTPAKLASKFGIRIERIDAILKLQYREENALREGHGRHNKEIEEYLWRSIRQEPISLPDAKQLEAETNDAEGVVLLKKKFMVAPDTAKTEDILRVLKILSPHDAKVHQPSTKKDEQTKKQPMEVVDAEPFPNKRFRFVFSSTKSNDVFATREKDGTLKTQQ